jgi:aspartyl-tRNA(Asn)/glutamyl-tRNA(Gln) amidotransferase subunit B
VTGGGAVIQETRLWDTDAQVTRSMRTKEQAHDYRYFPEPDLVPLELSDAFITDIRATLPELPAARRARFVEQLGLSAYDADVLTADRRLADYYEQALHVAAPEPGAAAGAAKLLANWVITELLGRLHANGTAIADSPVAPDHVGKLVGMIRAGAISGKIGKTVMDEMFATGKDPAAIVKDKGLAQISDTAVIEKFCAEAIAENPKAIEEYRGGKERALGSLVGAVMKKSRGQANPQLVNQILKEKLS